MSQVRKTTLKPTQLTHILALCGQKPPAKPDLTLKSRNSAPIGRDSNFAAFRLRTHLFCLRSRGKYAREQIQRIQNSKRNAHSVPGKGSDTDPHGDSP